MSMAHQSGPPAPPPGTLVTALMFIIGAVLVLPGLCTVAYIAMFAAAGELDVKEPMAAIIVVFWTICLAIAAAGVAILRAARRRLVARGS
jgi:hypothetical protein